MDANGVDRRRGGDDDNDEFDRFDAADDDRDDDSDNPDTGWDDDDDDDFDDGDDDEMSFAAVVTSAGGEWIVHELDDLPDDVASVAKRVRVMRNEGPAFAMVCVEDQYFAIVRPAPGEIRVLLSDATMATDDDFAADAMDEIGAEIPELTDEELDRIDPWAEGDMDILSDLGCGGQVMSIICDDSELWASEQLMRIAAEIGFETELADALGLDVD